MDKVHRGAELTLFRTELERDGLYEFMELWTYCIIDSNI